MVNAVPLDSTGRSLRMATAVAFCASLVAHVFFLVGLPAIRLFKLEPPIPIEVLPLKKRPPAPPQIEPPKAAEEKKPPRPPKAKGPSDKPPSKTPPLPPPPPAEDLRTVGPASANITLILRGPLLAKSPYRDGVDALLSALPDYHTLLDGTGLHPFDDLEALLIATPDPRDVTATFLAARHRGNDRIRALAQRSLGDGDPRQFRAIGDDLMVLGRPEDLARIAAAEAPGEGTKSAADLEAARWLEALRHFDDNAKDAAFLLTIADLPQLVRIPGGALPLPRTLRLAMSAEASPATRLLAQFDDEAQARAFIVLWPEVKTKLAESAPMFAGALDGLKSARNGKEVELAGRLPEAQLRLAFTFVRFITPRPPSPAVPPTPPPPQVPDSP